MNFISGKLLDRKHSYEYLDKLSELICETYQHKTLPVQRVISACDTLSELINKRDHLPLLLSLGMNESKAHSELMLVKLMLSREYLENRLKAEFGTDFETYLEYRPFGSERIVRQEWKPLGVLLHIAAGNVDALPVFSVIEGLLTGNINILKLPGTDDGLSIAILQKLTEIEPLISEYAYVFDYPSSDIESIKKMAAPADAVVVWGGDAAVAAVRNMAAPNTKIIEWGHKISFAYISGMDISDEDLEGIAFNICDTNQLLCNSCQGIFIDTNNYKDIMEFSERFLPILEGMSQRMPLKADPYLQAQKTLEMNTEELESSKMGKRVFKSETCSITAYKDDCALEPSHMYRNCWVKPLPREKLLSALLKYKNHLQTAALVCKENDRPSLEAMLFKTGVVRITSGRNMSTTFCGAPHDGEYPLRRYMKIVTYEY